MGNIQVSLLQDYCRLSVMSSVLDVVMSMFAADGLRDRGIFENHINKVGGERGEHSRLVYNLNDVKDTFKVAPDTYTIPVFCGVLSCLSPF